MMENKDRNRLAMHLGETLREARKRAELTQVDVAERVELATEVLGRIERGNMLPSVPTLRKLCRTLHVDANAMLGLDAETAPSWPEEPDREAEDLPELRRVLRTLRRMDAAQLSVVGSTATALLRYSGQRPEDPSE
ncbi:helix-turn-helix domain-containing protein [Archangium violaceum]|uniref:helix-turn-helix transcriptional regulator n=1 Tax=Archangium violaceum TaxID=83451 RepID=UPI00194F299B|nr:helix-turn-helix transcriptional regulator [Archangium violaceum]QRO02211.1 helix-turn-helix domain-containing protein [Archangium violaceum]